MNQSSHTGEEIINRKEYEKVFDFYNNHLTIFNIAKDLGVKRVLFTLIYQIFLVAMISLGIYILVVYSTQFILKKFIPNAFVIDLIHTIVKIFLYCVLAYFFVKVLPVVGSKKLNELIISIQNYLDASANHEKIEWHSEKRDDLIYKYREKKLNESNFNINNDLKNILTMIECSVYFSEISKPSKLKWPTLIFPIVLAILGPTTSKAISILNINDYQSLFSFTLYYCIPIIIVFFVFYVIVGSIINMYYMFLSSKYNTHQSLQECLIKIYNNKQRNQEIENIRCKILTK